LWGFDIEAEQIRTGNRVDLGEVDGDHAAPLTCCRFDLLNGDLRPPAGCGAKIDGAGTRKEQVMLVVDFEEFESSA
jgi:hypothetical protein